MMAKLHKIFGLLSIFGVSTLTAFVLISNTLIGDMPFWLSWRLLVVVPFVLIFGIKELKKATYYELLDRYGIVESEINGGTGNAKEKAN